MKAPTIYPTSVVFVSSVETAALEPSWGDISGRFVIAGDLDIDGVLAGSQCEKETNQYEPQSATHQLE